jgi:hypothetical protein
VILFPLLKSMAPGGASDESAGQEAKQ